MKLELAFALPAFTGNESKFKMLQADEIWFEEGQITVFLSEDTPTCYTSSLVCTY